MAIGIVVNRYDQIGTMIERHIRFEVSASGTDAFRRFFAEKYYPPMSEIEGFVSGRLLQPAGGEGEILMVLQFETPEASASWRESAAHESLQPELRSLHTGMHIQGYQTL